METKIKKDTTKVKKESTEIKLNPKVWKIPYNADLISQVLYVFFNNERKGTSSVKGKGDVSGGGKKPWKQKGTGRARSGSIRSPLWVGGGVAFGPNTKNWKRGINKKMVKKSICIMLSRRKKEDAVKIVNLSTKKALKSIRGEIGKEITTKTLIISSSNEVLLAMRNTKLAKPITPMGVNLKHIVNCKNILIDSEALNILENRLTNGK